MKVNKKIMYGVIVTAMGVNMIPAPVQAAPIQSPIVMKQSDNLVEYEVHHIFDVVDEACKPTRSVKLTGKVGELTDIKASPGWGYRVKPFTQQIITADMDVIELHYERIPYFVSFEGNGATGGNTPYVLVPEDGSIPLFPECGFTKEGYTFIGWSIETSNPQRLYQPNEKMYFTNGLYPGEGYSIPITAQWRDTAHSADYTRVDAELKKAYGLNESLYKDFSKVKAATLAVQYDKKNSEQAVVDGYATAIETAINHLEYKDADYTKVNAAIKKANELKKENYKDLSKVKEAVNAVVKGKNITEQDIVDGYATAIETAIQNSEKIERVKINIVIDSTQGYATYGNGLDAKNGIEVEKGKEVILNFGGYNDYIFKNCIVNGETITKDHLVLTPQEDMTITVNFQQLHTNVVVNPCIMSFSPVAPGYPSYTNRTIMVENRGDEPVLLMAPEAENFELGLLRMVGVDVPDTEYESMCLQPKQQAWFSIRPKDNLPVGNYSGHIFLYEYVEGPDGTESKNPVAMFSVAFHVKVPDTDTFDVNTSSSPLEGGSTTGDGTYVKGKTAKLKATPKEGYEFVSWMEDGQTVSDKKELSFKVSEDRNLLAVFKKKEVTPVVEKFDVNTSSSPLEGGSTTGDGTYDKGKTVKVTATPKEGYEFVSWMEDGQTISDKKELSFKISEDRNLLAVFKKKEVTPVVEKFEVKTSSSPLEGGTTVGDGTYDKGKTVKVTATPKEGYEFVSWMEDGQTISDKKELSFKISEDRNLLAVFKKKEVNPVVEKFVVRTNANPKEGGLTKGAGIYKENDTVCVSAEARKGYKFAYWLEEGKVVSDQAAFTFKATKDRDLLAVFNKVPVQKGKIPTGLSTNVFSWLGLAGLSAVAGTLLLKKRKK